MGGAVFNEAGTVVITNSTFTGNTASGGAGGTGANGANGTAGQGLGGGLFNHNGTITVTNSTFSGNTAAQGGRGIFNLGDSAADTTASASPTPSSARATPTCPTWWSIRSAAVRPRSAAATNLIGTTASLVNGATNTLTGTLTADPRLGPLPDNGGPTQTMALMGGSPAIDQGTKAGAPTTDQRGFARDPDNAGTVDIGAYERRGLNMVVNTAADATVDR